MTIKVQSARGYNTPILFRAPGPLNTYTTTGTAPLTVPPANGGTGVIEGLWVAPCNLCVSDLRMFVRLGGTAGSTQTEVWRSRAGVWTCIANATMGLAFGTDMGVVVLTPGGPTPVEYRTLYKNDIVLARLVTAATGAEDLTVSVEFR